MSPQSHLQAMFRNCVCVFCSRHVPCVDLRRCRTACSGKNVFGGFQNWALGLHGSFWHVDGQLQQGDAQQFPPGRLYLSISAARARHPASKLACDAKFVCARFCSRRAACHLQRPGFMRYA